MKFATVVFSALVACVLAEYRSYEGYKVYQVTPTTGEQMKILKSFEQNEMQFDFWSTIRGLNKPVDVMVEPKAQRSFIHTLIEHGISYRTKIYNVETTVKAERLRQELTPTARDGKISYDKYHRFETIQKYLLNLATTYPEVVQLDSIGNSYEGRPIYVVKISTGGAKKPSIFIDATIHAREWIAPPTVLYLIQELVENPNNRALIENIDWHIVPLLNPDGYEYSHTHDRYWRKTRSVGEYCDGTDGNRNFDFHWMEVGASDYECSDVFAGLRPFSESETRALRDYLLANADSIKLYLTFHSYGELLLYPWGYTSALPDDEPELRALANKVNDAIESYRGTVYEIGTSTNVLDAAAGGSDDWAKAVAGIELSYTVELPGGWWGFELPAYEIKGVVEETFLGIVAYHDYILEKFGSK